MISKHKYYILIVSILLVFVQACKEVSQVAETQLYEEPFRNQFHFSPPANWMNDPNGMFFMDGEYHLFYQYYPDSTVWGPMHWGHAVSEDLIHWEHLPIALYPDSLGYIFSGSAVVDYNNTSGFGKNGEPPVVAMFTHHLMEGEKAGRIDYQYQSIAYSNDKGRTWTKYDDNPVIPNPGIKDFRDPKVVWDEERSKWVMVLAAYDKAMFYTSPNLIDWTYESEFGIEGDTRLWECPDLFPMSVGLGDKQKTKWVLIVSIQKDAPNGGTGTSYFVGDWNGKEFIPDTQGQKWLDYGTDNYAFVTWSGTINKTIGIGWMSNWQYAQVVPSQKWRSAMTVPRRLFLQEKDNEFILINRPIQEYTYFSHNKELFLHKDSIFNIPEGLAKLRFIKNSIEVSNVSFTLYNEVGDTLRTGIKEGKVFIDRRKAGHTDFSESFASDIHWGNSISDFHMIDIFLDHASIEVFANSGEVAMTEIFFVDKPFTQCLFKSEDRPWKGNIDSFSSIWK